MRTAELASRMSLGLEGTNMVSCGGRCRDRVSSMKACLHRLGSLVNGPIDQDELVLARGDEGIDHLQHRGGI